MLCCTCDSWEGVSACLGYYIMYVFIYSDADVHVYYYCYSLVFVGERIAAK